MKAELLALLIADPAVALVVSDRVFWTKRDRGTALPAAVLHMISDSTDYALGGPTGYREALIQIDCLGATAAEADDVAQAIRTKLSGYRAAAFQGVFVDAAFDDFTGGDDGQPEIHRSILEARVKYVAA